MIWKETLTLHAQFNETIYNFVSRALKFAKQKKVRVILVFNDRWVKIDEFSDMKKIYRAWFNGHTGAKKTNRISIVR